MNSWFSTERREMHRSFASLRMTKTKLVLKLDCTLCRRARFLCLLGQVAEPRRIIHRQIRENLAIEFDSGFLQSADELVVVQSVQAGGGADAHDPDRAVLPLLLLASGVGKLQSALDGFFRRAVKFGF